MQAHSVGAFLAGVQLLYPHSENWMELGAEYDTVYFCGSPEGPDSRHAAQLVTYGFVWDAEAGCWCWSAALG